MLSGFTDDLFPASQALRVYMLLKGRKNAPVTLQLGDIGHARAQNKLDEYQYFNAQGAQFFDAYLRRIGVAAGAALRHRVHADVSLHRSRRRAVLGAAVGGSGHGVVRVRGRRAADGDVALAATRRRRRAPTRSSGLICAQFPATDAPGTAVYTAPSPGILLMGAPMLTARDPHAGPLRSDRRPAVGREPGRAAVAGRTRRLSAAAEPARPHRRSSSRGTPTSSPPDTPCGSSCWVTARPPSATATAPSP